MISTIPKLDKFLDALKEVGNVGAGKASGALSRLIDKKILLAPPEIYLNPVSEISKMIGGPQELVVGIYTAVSGEVSGTVLVVFPTQSALFLSDLLSKKKFGTTKALEKKEQLQLRKIGKVLSTSYLKTITEFLQLKVVYAESRIILTFGESLTDLVLLGIEERYALLLRTNFNIPKTDIKGDFILLLALESLTTAIEAIKKQIEV